MASIINASSSGSGGIVQTADASGVLQLSTNGTPVVTVDTASNVGVGTISPVGKLESKTSVVAPASANFAQKAFVADIPFSTTGVIGSMVAGFDGPTIHAVDLGYTYTGAGYSMTLSTNDDTTGSPIERMRIDPAGRITQPFQPSFLVRVNNTAYITTSPVPFSNEVFDVGSNFNNSTYRFTAPIAGKYVFYVNMYTYVLSATYLSVQIRVNGSQRQYAEFNNPNSNTYITLNTNAILELSVGDYIDIAVAFSGGATYYGGNSETQFMGFLLG
jgi:hypothetical protein